MSLTQGRHESGGVRLQYEDVLHHLGGLLGDGGLNRAYKETRNRVMLRYFYSSSSKDHSRTGNP